MTSYTDWMKALDAEKKAHEDWRTAAGKVIDRYEDEQDRDDTKFNILWSNTEVLHSAVYAKTPTPDIRRRFLDKDPAGKKASEVAERAVSYAMDVYDFDGTMDVAIDDFLLGGLGQVRLRYKPYYEKGEAPRVPLEVREKGLDLEYNMTYGAFNGDDEITEYELDEEQRPFMLGEPVEELVYEEIECEPVNWRRFRWQPSARWEDVDWACIEHYMTKDELEAEYGKENANLIPLGFSDDGTKANSEDEESRARVFEIFDRKNRKNIDIAEGHNEILREVEDPLSLEGYYPFPKPLMATLKNGKFLPIPDFLFYQDQAIELDKISNRIDKLTDELKHRGFYDASFEGLANLESAGDGEFLPIDDFSQRFNGTQGDIRKVIAAMPMEEIQRVLAGLYQAREEVKQTIYEITGLADIMRGSTAASETLGAQQIKAQFGSMRVSKRQKRVASFIRDLIRIKVEMMVENFDPQTLMEMTGVEFDEEVYEILTNDMMRSYRIDIETDSTIEGDQAREKELRIELVTAVTAFVEKVGPMVQMGIMPPNAAKELLGFAVRSFKIGRALEDVLDEIGGDDDNPQAQQMQQQIQQMQQQMEQQMQAQMEEIERDAQQRIEKAEGQAFEAQKRLAITKAVDEAGIVNATIKGEIERDVQIDKNNMVAELEMVKAALKELQAHHAA